MSLHRRALSPHRAHRPAWRLLSVVLLLLGLCFPASATPSAPTTVDWAAFLGRNDAVWQRLPGDFAHGAFIGNGVMGAMAYVRGGGLAFELGRVDVVDRRIHRDPMVSSPRLPIGWLVLSGCNVTRGNLRLNLWDAEITGSLGDQPTLGLRSFVHAREPVLVIESQAAASCTPSIEFQPEHPYADAARWGRPGAARPDAVPPKTWSEGSRHYHVQPVANGEAFVVAYDVRSQGMKQVVVLTITPVGPAARMVRDAQAALRTTSADVPEMAKRHRAWWHAYYPRSLVSLPDAQIESFYWLQMYKLGSATRASGNVIDTLGPWYHSTPWPGTWWNLNVQLSYWSLYAANRFSEASSLVNTLRRHLSTLSKNTVGGRGYAIGRASAPDLRSPMDLVDLVDASAPGSPREHGNLLWALHNVWQHATFFDDDALKREALRWLDQALLYYQDVLEPGADGLLHMPVSISPEYPRPAADTNYDLSLLRWAAGVLTEPSNRRWVSASAHRNARDLAARLPPLVVGEHGLMIGKDVPLSQSHRHFSHLLAAYPLGILSPDEPSERALIEKSLHHWIGFKGALEGYSYVAAAAISARLEKGDDALAHLQSLIKRYVKRNTMYMEAGPVIETPLAAAQVVHEMLLQVRSDVVRVFPALPSNWKDAAFADLRAANGLVVSAKRSGGVTRQINLFSHKPRTVRLSVTASDMFQVEGARVKDRSPTEMTLVLEGGRSAHLTQAAAPDAGYVVERTQTGTPAFGSLSDRPFRGQLTTKGDGRLPRANDVPRGLALRKWQVLQSSLGTDHAMNGSEEIHWQHSDCEPCVGRDASETTAGKAMWHDVTTGDDGCLDFAPLLPNAPKHDGIAFARATIMSDRDRHVQLRFGSNDYGALWLWHGNDTAKVPLHVNGDGKRMDADAAAVSARLRQGDNFVFVKIINDGGAWRSCLSITPAP